METQSLVKQEVYHRDYNLNKKDNLNEIPTEPAVFGVFAIVGEEPVNCRYVGETENLRNSLRELYENAQDVGLKKFMQGPWIQMILHEIMPESTKEQRESIVVEWKAKYNPKIDDDGEYPGYYES